MSLIGKKVNHKKIGEGTVVGVDSINHRIYIEFPGKPEPMEFKPKAVAGFLTAEDDKVQEAIMKEVQAQEADEAADKAASEEKARQKTESQAKNNASSKDKKYVPISREEGKALTFLVFQNKTFKEESAGQFIWAPKASPENGQTEFFWDNLMNVREGDVILHCANGRIKAVSRAKGVYTECNRPYKHYKNVEGRQVDCNYTLIDSPIKTKDYQDKIKEYSGIKYAPFGKNATGNMGFLYDIDSKLASTFLKATVEQNPELNDLDYIQWLL